MGKTLSETKVKTRFNFARYNGFNDWNFKVKQSRKHMYTTIPESLNVVYKDLKKKDRGVRFDQQITGS